MQTLPALLPESLLQDFAAHPTVDALRALLAHADRTLEHVFFEAARQHQYSQAAQLIRRHAEVLDTVLIAAWNAHRSRFLDLPPMALVAVGGYGRGEMHPHSDVDLMLLHPGLTPQAGDFATSFIRFLWDCGLTIGHSLRTPKECASQSRKDLTVATNIMEGRLLAGSEDLFQKAMGAALAPAIWPTKKFVAAKIGEQRERYRRYDDTAYNLEPNVKESPGGLRDIHMIIWLAQRHLGIRTLHELVGKGFLAEAEYRHLVRCRNFLWVVRTGLHYIAGRREDRLVFDHQRILAERLGYRDQPGRLAVEQLMKQYYRTVKSVELMNEILIQQFGETTGRPSSRVFTLNRRFQVRNGLLEAHDERVFTRFPFALLELFLLLQQHPEIQGVRASTIRLLLASLHLIDDAFRHNLATRSLFMEIIRQPRGITHELRRMNAYGVLGRYIPAFGRIVGQMQHDLFHVYTVDEHILFVLRNLRRFTLPDFAHEFPLASRLIQEVIKPERLYLAALFHDIAKGRGGDHSELGEHEVVAFCTLHGLSAYDTRFIAWLVRSHLIMSRTAQKEDITDPEVVRRFAELVGDQEHLDHLYLLTVADMRGTSPSVWNEWKGRLLSQLHAETTRVLRQGVGRPVDQALHVLELKDAAIALISDPGLRRQAETFWAELDDDYFLRYDPDSIAWHAVAILGAGGPLPVVAARHRAALGATELLVSTADTDGLFAVLTGGLDRLNLSVVEARIHTTHGRALDTFVILNPEGRAVQDPGELRGIEDAMREQLLAPRPGRHPARAYLPRVLRHFPIATTVRFVPSPRDAQVTLMEVVAQDRPGLLYQVGLALQQHGVRLINAKVATYGERAEDTFFLLTGDGTPIPASTLAGLRLDLLERLGPAPTPEPAQLVF